MYWLEDSFMDWSGLFRGGGLVALIAFVIPMMEFPAHGLLCPAFLKETWFRQTREAWT